MFGLAKIKNSVISLAMPVLENYKENKDNKLVAFTIVDGYLNSVFSDVSASNCNDLDYINALNRKLNNFFTCCRNDVLANTRFDGASAEKLIYERSITYLRELAKKLNIGIKKNGDNTVNFIVIKKNNDPVSYYHPNLGTISVEHYKHLTFNERLNTFPNYIA